LNAYPISANLKVDQNAAFRGSNQNLHNAQHLKVEEEVNL